MTTTTAPADSQPGDKDLVAVPRDLIGAACSAIDKKRDGARTLAELRRYTVGDLSAAITSAPKADSQPADGATWQDISTAPKDGTRFVAVGHNYGLCSATQHTCIAQWFRGCWMEVSDWNEASELKYLTHWMPLPPLPGSAARAPADSVPAPAATPTAASIAWAALRDLTDPLGETGVKIMGHVRVFAQRQYEAGLADGSADRARLEKAP